MSLKESNKQKINLPLQHFISAALDFGLGGAGAGGGGALIDARDVASILDTSASTALSACHICHIEMHSSGSARTSVVFCIDSQRIAHGLVAPGISANARQLLPPITTVRARHHE